MVYKFGGKRVRKVFADFAMAKAEARTAATKINNGQMETSQLSPEEFREFHTGRQILSELKGIKIDQALMEFAEAKKALRGGSLVQIKPAGGDSTAINGEPKKRWKRRGRSMNQFMHERCEDHNRATHNFSMPKMRQDIPIPSSHFRVGNLEPNESIPFSGDTRSYARDHLPKYRLVATIF